ncbi:hypothetical protein GCK72_007591 [Caenorhabditis remanei]|uniref:Uncharacterized protein n=1 Tax=Caenorhabditis remanei TaxID=31234 RepID=A0A6A5HPA6_CAERE|nr:hypothetical protein GCK72_007591 [Caenorhabditis remanei]KAF1767632.1 hypothetical protein GCK72_007591 [Caenorhabditis remanei]
MKVMMITGVSGVLSTIAVATAIAIRMIFLSKLNKSLLYAVENMQNAGQILKKRVLEPSVLAVIANERTGITDKEICDEYENCMKKPIKLCADLFGIDQVTTDFVKKFDSKLLSADKKSKKKPGKPGKKSKK